MEWDVLQVVLFLIISWQQTLSQHWMDDFMYRIYLLNSESKFPCCLNCSTFVLELLCCCNRIHLTSVVRRLPVVRKCRECHWAIKSNCSSTITASCHCSLLKTTLEPFHTRQGLRYYALFISVLCCCLILNDYMKFKFLARGFTDLEQLEKNNWDGNCLAHLCVENGR